MMAQETPTPSPEPPKALRVLLLGLGALRRSVGRSGLLIARLTGVGITLAIGLLLLPRTAAAQDAAAEDQAAAARAQEATANKEEAAEAIDRRSAWRGDPGAYMIAIESMVVEVNEDRTRDLGLQYGFTRNPEDLQQIVEGVDVLLGQPLSGVIRPNFLSGNEALSGAMRAALGLDAGDISALGFTAAGLGSAGIPRLPGLGINLAGMDISGGVVSARLRALLNQGEARITTRVIALARNDSTTVINVGSKVPYQDVTFRGGKSTLQVSFETVGVKLELRPKIVSLAKQIVELDIINVEVSSVSNFITTKNVNRPVFNTSETRTKVSMRSGETLQLSRLKGRRRDEVREGLPFLMHIPLLGLLFSSHQEVFQGVDILFFVTPYIVPPGENILVPFDFLHQDVLTRQGVELGAP